MTKFILEWINLLTFTKRDKSNCWKQGTTKSGNKMPKIKVKKERGKEEGRETFSDAFKCWFTATFQKSEYLGLNYTHTKRSPSWMRGRNRRRGKAGGGEQRSNTPICELWVIDSDTCSVWVCNNASVLPQSLSSPCWKCVEACFAVRWDSISSVARVNKRKYSCSGPPGWVVSSQPFPGNCS